MQNGRKYLSQNDYPDVSFYKTSEAITGRQYLTIKQSRRVCVWHAEVVLNLH